MPEPTPPSADAEEQNGGETPQNHDQAPRTEKQDVGSMTPEQLKAILVAPIDGPIRKDDALSDESEAPDPFEEPEVIDPFYDPDEEVFPDDETGEMPAEAEEEPETEEEEEPAPEETNEEEAEEQTEKKPDGRKRLNINRMKDGEYVYSDRERAYMALADEKGISLAEAERQLFGDKAPEPKAEKQEEQTPGKSVEDLQAEIAELEAASEKAADTLDMKTVLANQRKVRELDKQIEEVKRTQEQSRTATQTQLQTQIDASMEAAIAAYPDIAKKGTPLNEASEQEIARLKRVNPSAFNDPEWPEMVAAKVALKLGANKVTSEPKPETAKPAATKPKPTQPARKARPLPGPGEGATRAAKPTRTAADISADIATAQANRDMKRLAELVNEIPA